MLRCEYDCTLAVVATLNSPHKSEDRLSEDKVRLKICDNPVGVSEHTGRLKIATGITMEELLLQQYLLYHQGTEEYGYWQLCPGLSWCHHEWAATNVSPQAASCSCC